MLGFEDYSQKLKPVAGKTGLFEYAGCSNNDLVCEDSLMRTLEFAKTKDFAILSAYRAEFSKQRNIERNRRLRSILNSMKLGVHQLVGHWLEVPAGIEYGQAESWQLVDVVERSYLVVKPDNMDFRRFIETISGCLMIDGKAQDAALVHVKKDNSYYLMDSGGKFFKKIGTKLSLGKIGQAYSAHVKKLNVPFKFEGKEIPSSISGRMVFKENMIF